LQIHVLNFYVLQFHALLLGPPVSGIFSQPIGGHVARD